MKHTRGFTMVEMLLYTAIATSVAIASVALLRVMEDYRIRSYALADLTGEATVALERLATIVHAERVSVPATGEAGATLETAEGTTVSAVDGVLMRGNARLHADTVSLMNVEFSNVSSVSDEPLIHVSMTLAASLSGGSFAPGASLSRTYDTLLTTLTR